MPPDDESDFSPEKLWLPYAVVPDAPQAKARAGRLRRNGEKARIRRLLDGWYVVEIRSARMPFVEYPSTMAHGDPLVEGKRR